MKKQFKYLFFLLYGFFIYVTLFNQIGTHPIKTWDESLFACRALYMADNFQYMPNFNALDPVLSDHRNTKLPFTTFIQAASFKIFGMGEKTLRVPLGIILLLCFLYIVRFSKEQFNEPAYGYILSVILLTSVGFMRDHMARFGDHDVPFAVYILLSILFFYRYCEYDKIKDLFLFTFFSIAALLTKNLLSLIVLPGLFVYAMYKGVFFKLLGRTSTYVAAFSLVASYAFTIVYLENAYPGFFLRMWDYELFGRFSETIEGHKGGFFFYFELFFSHHHAPWFAFLWTIPFIFGNRKESKKSKDLAVCLLLAFLSYFLIVSMSSTKTAWYYSPLYMISAMLMAMGIVNFYRILEPSFIENRNLKRVLWAIGLCLVGYGLFTTLSKVALYPETEVKEEQYGQFMEYVEYKRPELKEYIIVDNNFGTVPYLYAQKYNREKNFNIRLKRGGKRIEGEFVLVCLNNSLNPIKRRYHIEELEADGYCKLIKIGEEK